MTINTLFGFLIKLGLKGEAIARPGTVGQRDRIYQVSGMADPFRDRLLAAARQRLAEASPDFDEFSVVDGLEMLRDAEGDEAALAAIWQALKALPEADQRDSEEAIGSIDTTFSGSFKHQVNQLDSTQVTFG